MCCQLCFLSCQLLTLDKKGLSRPLDYITFFMFNLYEHVIFYLYIKILTNIKQEKYAICSSREFENANFCWHFKIHDQNKFHTHVS